MAKARPRFVITGNMRSNDVDLRGQLVVLLGESNWTGNLRPASAKAKKWDKQYDHFKFRFEDRRWAKQSKVAGETFCVAKKHMGMFLTEYGKKP